MRKKMLIMFMFLLAIFVRVDGVFAETYENIDKDAVVSCGNGMIDTIPSLIPKVASIAYTVIQIAVPIVLIIMGSLDLFKGIIAQKEDEIKKGQQMLIKRLIVAAIVFFVFVIVKAVISLVGDTNSNRILDCAECFINNDCAVVI